MGLLWVVAAVMTAMAKQKRSEKICLSVDTRKPTNQILPSIADNINIFEVGNSFYTTDLEFPEYNEFEFVKWVQLMMCTGGSKNRDLFKNPEDRSLLTDYDFNRLIINCEGILKLGARPHLKLGAVPLKLCTDPKSIGFDFNVFPPDSYEHYYAYIKSIIEALVEHFGKEEVMSWRFGCLDEYENGSCFRARSGDPDESFEAYCKIYDYTVQALVDVLGDNVFVGAHSMSVLEGLWDERRFIEHVAKGKNWANGGNGTKINYLSVSFYDNAPGNLSRKSLTNTIKPLQEKASECGLENLIYGVDEGRILRGTKGSLDDILNSRASGYTWQAAEDARLFSEAISLGMDYFSAWNYLTGGNRAGFPTVSYHVAKNMAGFKGYQRLNVEYPLRKEGQKEIGCIAGVNGNNVKLMLYSFSEDIHARDKSEIDINIRLPFNKGTIKVTTTPVDDDCNYFDDWQEDQKKYNITNEAFGYSPDDGQVEASIILRDVNIRKLYIEKLRDKYIKCAELHPVIKKTMVKNGTYRDVMTIKDNSVLFIDITRNEK